MSVFAIIDFESELQLGDKTRFDASKSFRSKATTDINALTIKAGDDATAVSVYDTDSSQWFLDWCFDSFKIDVISANSDMSFKVGSTTYLATIATGSYTLAQYATALQTAMNSALANSFSVTISSGKATISGSNSFEFLESSAVTQLFLKLESSKASHTGSLIQYGLRTITAVATNAEPLTSTKAVQLKVYSEAGDRLFVSDQDLTAHEPDILKWVKDGRASYKDVYRRSQKLILAWLDEKGYVNAYNDKYTKFDIIDLEEVRQWSTFMSLRLIFEGISNSVEDIFSLKANKYSMLEEAARQRVILRIDFDKDGAADSTEGVSIYSGSLFRR
jgi:hypothetical protein